MSAQATSCEELMLRPMVWLRESSAAMAARNASVESVRPVGSAPKSVG